MNQEYYFLPPSKGDDNDNNSKEDNDDDIINNTDSSCNECEEALWQFKNAKIHSISIPLCILHAFDDPISSWRTVAANEGFMRPDHLVNSGKGNLMLLLTEKGGHVGWPLGWLSYRRKWEFMSEAAAGFANAVMQAKQSGTYR